MKKRKRLTMDEQVLCGEMFDRYKRFVYKAALERRSDRLSEDDIVQDTAYRLAENFETFSRLDERARYQYISQTVVSAATDQFRAQQKQDRLLLRTEPFRRSSFPSAEADCMEHVDWELLDKVLDELEERDRILLEGKLYMDLSDAEIAEMVGCKPDSVRMLVKRAKERAQRKLIKEGFTHDEVR